MRSLAVAIILITVSFSTSFSQMLVINEVSQGPSGSSKEYVEFVVAGTPSCTQSCLDMRNMVFDDNNGYFKNGSGQGIAAGAMRFANIAFWECIPVGTVIVIYNDEDRNNAIPADDVTMADGNFLLIIPASSSLLEKHETIPSTSNNVYSTSGWTTGGSWQTVAMANGADSFQVRENILSSTPTHAISYGSNTQNNVIYFAGSASELVYSFKNTTDNNPSLQANWVSENVSTGQTPGAGNSPENSAWIASLRNGGSNSNLVATITPVNIGCGETCTGSATVNVTGGTSPYTYEWSNGETSQGITDLCAGNYSVEVTDALGCSTTANVSITTTPNSLNVTFNQTNIVCPSACNGNATATITGGTAPYLYEWENGETSNSISNLCAGNYTIEVTDANNCTTTATVEIVDLSIPIQITTNVINESCENTCDGSIITTITGGVLPNSFSWNTGQNTQNISNLCDGNYTLTVTDNNGCIQTSQATVLPGDATPTPIITPVNDLTVEDQAVQVVVNTTGGSWSSDCGTCLSATGVFDPAIAGVGTFEICYTIGTGACQETTCIDITVVEHCIPQTTTSTITGCPGETIVINGQPITASGTYPFTFTGVNGCDSTHIVTVTIFTTNPTHDIATICLGDSVEIAGVWHFDAGVIPFETTDANGCILENTTTIIIDDCVVPDFNVFIPNSFTPNGDNVNDVFPITITDGELIEGYIFNRWGEIVKTFSATDLNWDGKTKSGQLSPDGVYSYWVIIQKDGGIAVEYHGFVTLIR